MISMTGYGRAVATHENMELVVEISSVNRRNLETQVSTPKEWVGLDRLLTDKIRGAANRGKVYLQLKVKDFAVEDALPMDRKMIGEALHRLHMLADELHIRYEPDTRLLLDVITTLKQGAELPDWAGLRERIEAAVDDALAQWSTMRRAEGRTLQEDFHARVAELQAVTEAVAGHAGNTVAEYRDKLMERLRSSGLELDADDERVLKEIALFADRCDISEELTRLNSHFVQLEEAVAADGPIGRKIDFILQEVYREFNTIGSKSNNLDISRLVIEGKNLWEQLREQAANIE